MRKTFEFVKVGGVWFYWWPDYDGQVPINYEKISPLFLEKKDAIEWAVTQNYWDIRLIEEEVL